MMSLSLQQAADPVREGPSPSFHSQHDKLKDVLNDDTPDLDDCVFNTLGVLSHGALLNPCKQEFVDWGARELYTAESTDKMAALQEAFDESNLEYYRMGEFHRIRPCAALELWSSVEPVAESGATSWSVRENGVLYDDSDYLAWPQSSALLGDHSVHATALRQVRARASRCTGSVQKALARGKRVPMNAWQDAEHVRLRTKAARSGYTPLAPTLAVKMQYDGELLPRCAAKGTIDTSLKGPEGDAALASRSTATSFSCYTGRPMFEAGSLLRRQSAMMSFAVSEEDQLYLRVRKLQPHNHDAVLDVVPLSQVEVGKAYLHLPDRASSTQRQRHWWIFRTYFAFLGVEEHTTRQHSKKVVTYTLSDNSTFSAADCVRRKCEAGAARAQRRRSKAVKGPTPSAGSTLTGASHLSRSWDYLMLHQEHALRERLARVEAYLEKLNERRTADQQRAKRRRSPSE